MLDVAKIDHGQLELECTDVCFEVEVAQVMSMIRHTINDRPLELQSEVTPAVPRSVRGYAPDLSLSLLSLSHLSFVSL